MSEVQAPTSVQSHAAQRPHTLGHILLYMLSLPERVLRWLVAALGGLVWWASALIPRRLRKGRFYKLAVERQIKMLTDDVGQAGLFRGQEELDRTTATRMAIGGTVDNLMMVGLHASPLWILLAAGDLTDGARAFTREIGQELRDIGVLGDDSPLDSVDHVLGGLGRLSERLADTLDMPPLDTASLRDTVSSLREDLGELSTVDLDSQAGDRKAQIDALAREFLEVAENEKRSVLEVAGGAALDASRRTGEVVVGGLAGVGAAAAVTTRFLWNDVVVETGRSLDRIRRLGLFGSLRRATRSARRSSHRLFDWHLLSVTEWLLSAGRLGKAPWKLGKR